MVSDMKIDSQVLLVIQRLNKIMQKLWLRENTRIMSLQTQYPKYSESQYVETISKIIKIFKKKEQLYFRVLDLIESEEIKLQLAPLKLEHQLTITEQTEIINGLIQYKSQPYYESKTYLYTVFMRLNEVLEFSKQKAKKYVRNNIEKIIDDHKLKVQDCYQNLNYFKTFHINKILQVFKNFQNQKICKFVPRKKQTLHRPPPPSAIDQDKTKSVDLDKPIKRKNSKQRLKPVQDQLDFMVSKKLLIENYGAIKQRIQNKRKSKEKQFLKIRQYNKLFKIMEIKKIQIPAYPSQMKQLEGIMMERNAKIIEQRKRYEKYYQTNIKGFRSKTIIQKQRDTRQPMIRLSMSTTLK